MMNRAALSLSFLMLWATIALGQPAALAPSPIGQPQLDPALASALTIADGPSQVNPRTFWMGADFLGARVQSAKLPPLITTSIDDTSRDQAGIIGFESTRIAYAGPVNDNVRAGLRVAAGWWFYPDLGWGIEAGFTMLESQSTFFSIASDGSPILARPYFDSTTGESEAILVAFPDSSTGSIGTRAFSGNFYSANINLVDRAYDNGFLSLTPLMGYRYYSYDESLRIQQNLFPTSSDFVAGTAIVSIDNFGTRNRFHGLDLGLRTEFQWGALSLELLTRVAFGRLNTFVGISGSQVNSVPDEDVVVSSTGVFTLRSNVGIYSQYRLTAMPEFGASFKWQVSEGLQLRFGYSFILLNDVVRAADQIDRTIDPSNFTPASSTTGARPAFQFHRADIWIQSLNAGMEFRF